MIPIALIGSASIGLVWGWLLGNLITRICRPIFDGLMISGLTLILAADIFFKANGWALAFFLSMTSIATLFHMGWRHKMYKKFGHTCTNF
jgi:hypothetical protein